MKQSVLSVFEKHDAVNVLKEVNDRLEGLIIHKYMPSHIVEYMKVSVLTSAFRKLVADLLEAEDSASGYDVSKVEEDCDTEKCVKCQGRTGLVSGWFHYEQNQEPYLSGEMVDERATGEKYLCAYVCDDCNHIQGMFDDNDN